MNAQESAEWLRKQYGLPKPSKAKLKALAAERKAAQQLVDDMIANKSRQKEQKALDEALSEEQRQERIKAVAREIAEKFVHLRENRR